MRLKFGYLIFLALAVCLAMPGMLDKPLKGVTTSQCYCSEYEDVSAWCYGLCSTRDGVANCKCPADDNELGGECYAGLCSWECVTICKNGFIRFRTWFWACPDCPK